MNDGRKWQSRCVICAILRREFGRSGYRPILRQPTLLSLEHGNLQARRWRVQNIVIVGEDEADPKTGSISFVSPVARILMGKAVGDVVGTHRSMRL